MRALRWLVGLVLAALAGAGAFMAARSASASRDLAVRERKLEETVGSRTVEAREARLRAEVHEKDAQAAYKRATAKITALAEQDSSLSDLVDQWNRKRS